MPQKWASLRNYSLCIPCDHVVGLEVFRFLPPFRTFLLSPSAVQTAVARLHMTRKHPSRETSDPLHGIASRILQFGRRVRCFGSLAWEAMSDGLKRLLLIVFVLVFFGIDLEFSLVHTISFVASPCCCPSPPHRLPSSCHCSTSSFHSRSVGSIRE